MNSAQNWPKKQYPHNIAPLMNGYVKVTRLIKLNWSKKKGDHAPAANNPSLPPPPLTSSCCYWAQLEDVKITCKFFTMTEISTAKLWVSSVTWESSQADKGSLASFNNSC